MTDSTYSTEEQLLGSSIDCSNGHLPCPWVCDLLNPGPPPKNLPSEKQPLARAGADGPIPSMLRCSDAAKVCASSKLFLKDAQNQPPRNRYPQKRRAAHIAKRLKQPCCLLNSRGRPTTGPGGFSTDMGALWDNVSLQISIAKPLPKQTGWKSIWHVRHGGNEILPLRQPDESYRAPQGT